MEDKKRTHPESGSSVVLDSTRHERATNDGENHIVHNSEGPFASCWERKVSQLRPALASKAWYGFDLDDTLHEYRKASGAATEEVLTAISQKYDTSLAELKSHHSEVLRTSTSGAFADGKTSHEYRKERFAAVLSRFPTDHGLLDDMVALYEVSLTKMLRLKCGALELLALIRSLGKKIVVITEGPQDAQERAVNHLGIATYIDFLATTNHFGASKTNGLFPKVLEHLHIGAADLAYLGDSEERDMKPAMNEGIFCVYFAENDDVSLDVYPPKINTLKQLGYIISSEPV